MQVSTRKNSTIQVRLDKKKKEHAEKIIRRRGYTPSFVIDVFYSQIIENNDVPFKIVYSEPNAKTAEAIRNARKGIDTKDFENVDDMLADLKS